MAGDRTNRNTNAVEGVRPSIIQIMHDKLPKEFEYFGDGWCRLEEFEGVLTHETAKIMTGYQLSPQELRMLFINYEALAINTGIAILETRMRKKQMETMQKDMMKQAMEEFKIPTEAKQSYYG